MIAQLSLGVLGVTAIWLSQGSNANARRFACVFGLAAQPFWFYATWQAEQWGIFALCFLYTWAWLRGLTTNWLAPFVAARRERATWGWLGHLWRGRG